MWQVPTCVTLITDAEPYFNTVADAIAKTFDPFIWLNNSDLMGRGFVHDIPHNHSNVFPASLILASARERLDRERDAKSSRRILDRKASAPQTNPTRDVVANLFDRGTAHAHQYIIRPQQDHRPTLGSMRHLHVCQLPRRY
jgi:hypothetical protein